MKIDHLNYEEFFILYADNELNSSQRAEVEAFMALHPDLKEELNTLIQLKLTPDHSVVFENKEELFQIVAPITQDNEEEWLLLYTDNELTAHQRLMVEEYASAHSSFKQDLTTFSHTRLEPENISFPDKSVLYRKEEDEKSRPVIWWKWAAAAVLVLSASALLLTNQQKGSELPPAISGTTGNETNNIVTPGIQENNTATIIQGSEQADLSEKPTSVIPPVQTNTEIDNKLAKNSAIMVKGDKINIEKQSPKKISPITTEPVLIASNKHVTSEVRPVIIESNTPDILPLQQNTNTHPVTSEIATAYYPTEGAVDPDIIHASEESGKKNKFRGFLRKVTRTFEKRTNIDATDDDDRLLVGGLAIRL